MSEFFCLPDPEENFHDDSSPGDWLKAEPVIMIHSQAAENFINYQWVFMTYCLQLWKSPVTQREEKNTNLFLLSASWGKQGVKGTKE